ncbi:MAG: hypothetical protein Alpg2KO_14550 [Alphaproteobacteria bacterium]
MAHKRLKSFAAHDIVDGLRSIPQKLNQVWQERPTDVLLGAGFTLMFGPASGLTYVGLVTVGDAAAKKRQEIEMARQGGWGLDEIGVKSSLFSFKGIKEVFSRGGEAIKRAVTERPSARMLVGIGAVAGATALTSSFFPAAFVAGYWGISQIANRVAVNRARKENHWTPPRP